MRNTPFMGSWLYFPIHSRGTHRHCSGQFIPRYCPPRHLLCSSSLPLCFVHRSRIRYCRRLCSLIPTILRIHPSQHLNKNPLRYYVLRSKSNLLPPTLLRTSRDAPTILRLPWRLYPMKYSLLNWIDLRANARECHYHNVRRPVSPNQAMITCFFTVAL